jgi:hypothetical protein
VRGIQIYCFIAVWLNWGATIVRIRLKFEGLSRLLGGEPFLDDLLVILAAACRRSCMPLCS